MARATLTKGTITHLKLAITREFMFNPAVINDSKSAMWGADNIPGMSHPVYQFGSGGKRLISFQLYFDGDRGRILSSSLGGGRQAPLRLNTSDGLDVSNELRFYRSLLFGDETTLNAPGLQTVTVASTPSLVMFTFGSFWKQVQCTVHKADIVSNFFTPRLEPVRATINLTLEEAPSRQVFRNEVISSAVSDVGGPGINFIDSITFGIG